jgi:hypothetical protein
MAAVMGIDGNLVTLLVSAPLHSRYMQSAMLAFAPALKAVEFRPLKGVVVGNFRVRPYRSDQIRDNLVFQIRHQFAGRSRLSTCWSKERLSFTSGPRNSNGRSAPHRAL